MRRSDDCLLIISSTGACCRHDRSPIMFHQALPFYRLGNIGKSTAANDASFLAGRRGYTIGEGGTANDGDATVGRLTVCAGCGVAV